MGWPQERRKGLFPEGRRGKTARMASLRCDVMERGVETEGGEGKTAVCSFMGTRMRSADTAWLRKAYLP
jgi:hypothetical protein